MSTDTMHHYLQAHELKGGMVVARCDVINSRPVTIKTKPKTDYIVNDGKRVTTIETEYGTGLIYSDTMFVLLNFDRKYL